MLDPVLKNPWVRAIGLLLAFVGIGVLGYLLSPVLIPLFGAFMVAYMLDPLVDYFENADGKSRFWKWKVRRGVTISALAILGLIVAFCGPLVLIPSVIGQAKGLIEAAKDEPAAEEENGWYDQFMEVLPLDEFIDSMGWERPEGMDARGVLASKVGGYVKSHATEFVQSNASSFATAGQWAGTTVAQVFASIGRVVLGAILFLGNFALFAFVAGYLLKDYDRLIAQGKELIPPRHRENLCRILSDIDKQLKSFIRGQMTVCFCLGTMYAVGLLICGVPFAILIAAFGMVASFVPYLGVVLTVGPALLMTFLQHGLDWQIIGVLVTFAIAQGLEGNVLTPKIVGDQVGLHPVWVILAILVFGSALGFLGLLIAVPLAASLKVLVVEGVAYYKRSAVFGNSSGSSDSCSESSASGSDSS